VTLFFWKIIHPSPARRFTRLGAIAAWVWKRCCDIFFSFKQGLAKNKEWSGLPWSVAGASASDQRKFSERHWQVLRDISSAALRPRRPRYSRLRWNGDAGWASPLLAGENRQNKWPQWISIIPNWPPSAVTLTACPPAQKKLQARNNPGQQTPKSYQNYEDKNDRK